MDDDTPRSDQPGGATAAVTLYWIGRQFWGRGIATRALAEFLQQVAVRPLYARAAKGNIASLRVLVKCGLVICGEDQGFSNARNAEVEEFVLRLEAGSL